MGARRTPGNRRRAATTLQGKPMSSVSDMTKKSRGKEPARGCGSGYAEAREGDHEVQPRGGEGVTKEGYWVGGGEQE